MTDTADICSYAEPAAEPQPIPVEGGESLTVD